ncbi:hypothetical protein [Paracoccus alkanivorans]|uniref:hypothetical protein n=1 Tax=Paracoccus alkanivorans TaxID=2116655 RepID=UPI003C7DD368
MRLLSNARLARIDGKSAHYAVSEPMPLVKRGDRIAWIGAEDAPPDDFAGAVPHDLGGRTVTPGLIDCHSHIVFGGDRAREFEMRLEGVSYEDIACNGDGRYGITVSTRLVPTPSRWSRRNRRILQRKLHLSTMTKPRQRR